ncbi:glycosyl transferase [Opitutaceae bacterium TAV5]|nr:glycosyl transferase [Opitutaceae bacterium TAV5]
MNGSLREHFDWVAGHDGKARKRQTGFHRQLARWFRFQIPEKSRVLEWGCGSGELLRALAPARGLGVDLSPRKIGKARRSTAPDGAGPCCEFRTGDVMEDVIEEKFDHIVMDYLAGYVPDIQRALENVRHSAHPRTRLYITTLNTPWKYVLGWGERIGWVMKQPPSNWLSSQDIVNLLELAGWEVVCTHQLQLWPFETPVLGTLLNRFAARMPLLRHCCMTLAFVARPRASPPQEEAISCSVVIPARNEAGNIRPALERVPVLGRRTEIIFVEGGSTDDTWETILKEIALYAGPHCVRAIRQPGKGKWDAVRTGFAAARGEVLVIQDADLTAPPEDLPKFYETVAGGLAEFANGCRLVYPMESRAMRLLNFAGNKFFASALSWVLGQPVKDSLCGTKMIRRDDYERLLGRISSFGDFDPFGDFNLIYGAALLNLRIRDIPVRYRDRTYGDTNISRFSHGWMLLKMTWFGLCHIRFHK